MAGLPERWHSTGYRPLPPLRCRVPEVVTRLAKCLDIRRLIVLYVLVDMMGCQTGRYRACLARLLEMLASSKMIRTPVLRMLAAVRTRQAAILPAHEHAHV